MSQLAFANAATSTLAVAITNSATSLTVAPGTGSLFPAISTGQCFLATIFPATGSTPAPEIVLVSAVASNVFTVTRAQEGTTAQAWGVGSIISQLNTAGTMDLLLQSATYAGNPNGHVAGTQAGAGLAPSVVWDSSDALFWVCTMTGTTSTAQWSALAPLNSPAFTGSPTAPTQSQSDDSTKLATTAYVDTGLATKAAVAGSSSQVFAVAPPTSNADAVNLGQFGTATGFQKLPSGIIIQWGVNTVGAPSAVTFPMAFPHACLSVVVSEANASSSWAASQPSVHGSENWSQTGFTAWSETWNGSGWVGGANAQSYIAIGW